MDLHCSACPRPVAAGPAARPRIFVDCTQTLACRELRGIPRVVRGIVRHGRRRARLHGVELVPIRFEAGRFVRVDAAPEDSLPPHAAASRPTARWRIARRMGRLAARARGWLGRGGPEPVAFGPHDVLLLPDSSWRVDFWGAIDAARALGVALGVVQHDFIPLRHPHLVSAGCARAFSTWMHETLSRADFVLAVSETVAAEARAALADLGRPFIAERCVTSFRNGADFGPGTSPGPIRPALARFLAAGARPYLTVGTVERRKNQGALAPVIARVAAAAPEARFLIAGAVGARGEAELEPLRRLGGWGRTVVHVADLDDAEIDAAYRGAQALVFPSLAEGYGLPIVEALARGTRVFASDIPVHREIGREWCAYFDPHDPARLAALLVDCTLRNAHPARWPAVGFEPPTWDAAAGEIVAAALRHARRRPGAAAAPPQVPRPWARAA